MVPGRRLEPEPGGPGILDLLGRLASDGVQLLKEESQLVTLHVREILVSTLWGTVRVAVPLALAAIAGVLLIIGGVAWLSARLGSLWAGALVGGGALLLVALLLLWLAARSLGGPVPPSGSADASRPLERGSTGESPRLVPASAERDSGET